MAKPHFQALRGTRDVLSPESERQRELVAVFAEQCRRAGYGQIVSPIFEDLGVFLRVGESTEIVTKEMYEFEDRDGRRIALRPELTASVVRAFLQHNPTVPWKAWYEGPQFRHERPQAGRYRQFSQVGVEVLGTDDPHVDVEVIALGWRFYEALGLRDVTLLINTLGDGDSRQRYLGALAAHLEEHRGDLSDASRETLERNPMRVLDSKRPEDAPIVAGAPVMADFLSEADAEHFDVVRRGLERLGIGHEITPRLVRGLDYYTRTTFEYASAALDTAQNALGGGGRYDGLAESLGGKPTPGIGLALGVERTLLACDAESVFPAPSLAPDVFVIDLTGGDEGTDLSDDLRQAGLAADRAFDGRSLKAQMKLADRSGAAFAAIVGEDELAAGTVTVRDLRGDSGQTAVDRADIVSEIRKRSARS